MRHTAVFRGRVWAHRWVSSPGSMRYTALSCAGLRPTHKSQGVSEKHRPSWEAVDGEQRRFAWPRLGSQKAVA